MRDKVSGYTYSLELIRDTRTPQFDVSIKNERADTVNYASLTAIVILLLMALCIYIVMKKIHGSFRTR